MDIRISPILEFSDSDTYIARLRKVQGQLQEIKEQLKEIPDYSDEISDLDTRLSGEISDLDTRLSGEIDELDGEIDALVSDVVQLSQLMPKKEIVIVKITPEDWDGSLEYVYENDTLTLDKDVRVSATVDGTVVDGVTVNGNAVYIGSYVIEPTAQTTAGQLTFKAQSTPTENVYITLEIASNGVTLE